MNNDAIIPLPPKYHFWLSENYDFFPQSMSINLPPVPVICYLNTVSSHNQNPHWFPKKYQYPITNYIIEIVLSFPLWFRSTAITGTMKIVHYKNELALRALWLIYRRDLYLPNRKPQGKYCLGFCDCIIYACKTSGSEFFESADFSKRQEMKVS